LATRAQQNLETLLGGPSKRHSRVCSS